MNDLLFPAKRLPVIPTKSGGYPIHRIFCVGRNYAEHAKEMGHEVDRQAPFYFLKDARSYVPGGLKLPYPPGTSNLHHEIELVVALRSKIFRGDVDQAEKAIGGYGVGLDMTRRDLQAEAKEKRRSRDLAKNFEQSAVLSPLVDRRDVEDIAAQKIELAVNGVMRQSAKLSDMIWSVPEIISHLSAYYHLEPGDIILTGTPSGVGPVAAGDQLLGRISNIGEISVEYLKPE